MLKNTMSHQLTGKLVIAISSRALFDLDESHAVYENEGLAAYIQYQIAEENNILKPGVAFPLAQKLLALQQEQEPLVEVILLSRNSADTGLRIFNSIQHHGLNITRAAFTNGKGPHKYAAAFGSHLFLSADPQDVRLALESGHAAATILPCSNQKKSEHHPKLHIAFDGDSVIFSDEAERIFQTDGLTAFQNNEMNAAQQPLGAGPFKGFLTALHHLQNQFPADECPIRTALVTARNAPAHERVIRTLRYWNIRIDEAFFLGGIDKGEFLRAFAADFYFDDQQGHCLSANQHVATAHVPSGIVNNDH